MFHEMLHLRYPVDHLRRAAGCIRGNSGKRKRNSRN